MISPATELSGCFGGQFRVLIFDNEVTVDAFVFEPPLPWARLVWRDGGYRTGDGYPSALNIGEADREERNWDQVSQAALHEAVSSLDETVDLVAIGNNAGQGVPLANALAASLRATRAIIIYGSSLPERPAYEAMGYRRFSSRGDLLSHVVPAAEAAGRSVALGFINTIEHNEHNYHTPWTGR